MTMTKLAAGVPQLLPPPFSPSAFAAQGEGGYTCARPGALRRQALPMTHCLTWTKVAAARMRAATCDPGK